MDIPSPIDLRNMDDAVQWAESAIVKRPWRTEFFAAITAVIATQSASSPSRVLELGSGPGFLAEHILSALPGIRYVALDFSSAMHTLAQQRLGPFADSVQFIERSFRDPSWSNDLGQFHFVVTHQAVHELRHKRYATALHAQVRQCLLPGGKFLVGDHYFGAGGMADDQLYMTIAEQEAALLFAGFVKVEQLLFKRGLVLHCAS